MHSQTAEARPSREEFLRAAGVGALALGAMTALGSRPARAAGRSVRAAQRAQTPQSSDTDILNFALNLEFLEAEFYLRAVTGNGLSTYLNNFTPGNVNGGTAVPFQIPALGYWAERIANDELAHVNFLLEALGPDAIPEPDIDFVAGFEAVATAAGYPAGTFNAFGDEISFLIGAYVFEDVGVTAYGGAAPLLTQAANIAYGASILAVEAEHAGAIRQYLAQIGGGGITNAISMVRQSLTGPDGPPDNGTQQSNNPYNFVNADYNGQTYRRTPQQVLNIVFGTSGTGVTSGAFFPNGVNGNIQST